MTVRGKHIQCDFRDTCVVCSIYTWPPDLDPPNRYHHCNNCEMDILCHLGLRVNYDYEESLIVKTVTCSKCGEKLQELTWPDSEK